MTNILWIILTFWLSTTSTIALVGYDCQDLNDPIQTYDPLSIKNCGGQKQEWVTTTKKVQIVQQKNFLQVEALKCDIKIAYSVVHCGMHSHSSISYLESIPTQHELSPSECKDLHQGHPFRVPYSDLIIGPIKYGEVLEYHGVAKGVVDTTGKCAGADFVFKGKKFSSHVLHFSIKIRLEKIKATAKVSENVISFPSGLECVYKEETCYDSLDGTYSWMKQRFDCLTNSYDVLYQGPANVTQNKEDEVILSIANGEFVLATKLTFNIRLCSFIGKRTSIEGLFVISQVDGQFQIHSNNLNVKNIDLIRYVNSKIGFYIFSIAHQQEEIIKDILKDICDNTISLLQQQLLILRSLPETTLPLRNLGPGIVAKLAGEVMHVFNCKPVNVILRSDFKRCTHEIPIIY